MKPEIKAAELLLKTKNVAKYLEKNNWILTVVFFAVILVVSVFVWYQAVVNPKAGNETRMIIESSKKDYFFMMKEIKSAAEMLNERKKKFDSPPFASSEREYFYFEKEEDELPQQEQEPQAEPAKLSH